MAAHIQWPSSSAASGEYNAITLFALWRQCSDLPRAKTQRILVDPILLSVSGCASSDGCAGAPSIAPIAACARLSKGYIQPDAVRRQGVCPSAPYRTFRRASSLVFRGQSDPPRHQIAPPPARSTPTTRPHPERAPLRIVDFCSGHCAHFEAGDVTCPPLDTP